MKNIIKTTLIFMATIISLFAGDLTTDNLNVINKATFYGAVEMVGPPSGSVVSNGMKLQFSFPTNSATQLDESGNTNTGTVVGSPVWTNGVTDGGYYFTSANTYIYCADKPQWDFSGDFAICMWVKFTGSSDIAPMSHNDNSVGPQPNQGWYVKFYLGNLYFGGVNGSSEWDTSQSYSDGSWHQVVITRRSNTIYAYKDISLVAQTGMTSGPAAATNVLYIGRWNGSAGYYFPGTMDNVRIYNAGLTHSDVSNMYFNALSPTNATGRMTINQIICTNAISQTSASGTNIFLGKLAVGTNFTTEAFEVNGNAIIQGNLNVNGTAKLTATNATALSGYAVGSFVKTNHSGNVSINGSIIHVEKYGNLGMGIYTNQ